MARPAGAGWNSAAVEARPTGTRAGALVLALVVALVGIAGGCGIRQDDQPRPVAIDARTKQLFNTPNASTSTAPANPANPATESRVIYLVRTEGSDQILVPVPSPVATPTDPAALPKRIIEQLVARQPDTSELKSFIPHDTRILGVSTEGNVLAIDLSSELGTVEGNGLRLAIAQLVFTATAIPGISFVRFSIEGSPTAVPLDDKTAEVGALISRDDFPKLGGTSVSTQAPAATSTSTSEPSPSTAATPPG